MTRTKGKVPESGAGGNAPMRIADAARRTGLSESEILARIDEGTGEVRAACMLVDARYGRWYAGEPTLAATPSACGHRHVSPDGAMGLSWDLVRPFVLDRRYVAITLSCGDLFQRLADAPTKRLEVVPDLGGVAEALAIAMGAERSPRRARPVARATRYRLEAPTVAPEIGIPIGLPPRMELADGRTITGLWCLHPRHDLALADVFIVAEDLPNLRRQEVGDDEHAPRHERELLLCIGTLAKLLAEHAPPKFQFSSRRKDVPYYTAKKIADAVELETGTKLTSKTVAGWLGDAKNLLAAPDNDPEG